MDRPLRPPGESLLAGGRGIHVVWVGLFIGGLSIYAQWWGLSRGSEHWQTMVFTVLTFAQLFHVMTIRSEPQSLFSAGLGSNLPLLGAAALGAVLHLAVVYVPPLAALLKAQPLTALELAFCVLLPASVFVAVEIEKWLVRRGAIYWPKAGRRGVLPEGCEPAASGKGE